MKIAGKEIPESFIYQLPNKAEDHDHHEIEYMDSNIVDLCLLSDPLSNLHEEELRKLRSIVAKSLSIEENSFFNACGGREGVRIFSRFNYYPPCSSPSQFLGIKPHSDGSALTILVQDNEVEGLQVLKDDQGYKVPIVSDALFINIGDQLETLHTKSPSRMAVSSSPPLKLELPSKPVQELLKTTTSKQVPERYIYRLPTKSDDDHTEIKYMDSPIIDLSLLTASSSQQREEEFRKLQSVLRSWGCLQLINHGLPSSLLDRIREVGKEFFALPLVEKQKHSRTLDWFEGYGGDTVSEGQNYNWNDRLHLRVHPLEQRNFRLWPEYLPNFRETLEEYALELRRLLEMILKAIAKSLNLEEDSIFRACGGKEGINIFTRFNYYPPCSTPDQVLGLKPHSDGTAVTILLQDKQVEGLQVQKDNKWFKVPIVPDALFINIGDQLEIMSNGILKSAVHKVVVDKERERISVAAVCFPHLDKEIGPFSELIDQERPQQYRKIKNYASVFFEHYSRGERAINAMKI